MDLHKDIINELIKQGYSVDFIPEFKSKWDPRNKKGYVKISKFLVSEKLYNKRMEKYWTKLLYREQYNKNYDILFVLDGQSVRPILFQILKKRNKSIRLVNYLYDTTTGVYAFDKNFRFYDTIASFDITECKKFNLIFLPIYWIKDDFCPTIKYDMFGLGSYSSQRLTLFNYLKKISDEEGYRSRLELFAYPIRNLKYYKVKQYLRKLIGAPTNIPVEDYESELVTQSTITPKEFRECILSSKITIDTSAVHQDGLTARFMWALGGEKKIVTSNQNVVNYPFYSTEQILLIDPSNVSVNEVKSFIEKPFTMSNDIRLMVLKYRIDNWIKFLIQ